MNHLKKICLFGVIGFLSLSALIAVVSLISGDFGDTQVKIILTTLTISAASVCGLACFAFIEKRGFAPIGGLGVLSAFAAAVLGILAIWDIVSAGSNYGKITLTLVIAAVAFAHALLLHLPTLLRHYRWTQHAVTLFDLILAVQLTYALWKEVHSTDFYRGIGVVTVFVVLFTLIVPICARLGASHLEEKDVLTLRHELDDIYRDEKSGTRYRVTKA